MDRPGRESPLRREPGGRRPSAEKRDEGGPLPLYHRVYTVLREQILEGAYPQDAPMPGENELGTMFGVSRVTIRRTLDRLQEDGLVIRRRGVGTFASPHLASQPVEAHVRGFVDNLVAMGLRTGVEVLEVQYMVAPAEIVAALGLAAGAVVQKAVRLRSYQGRPFSHATTYTRERVARTFTAAELESVPLLQLLQRSGDRVVSARQRVTAKSADPTVAALLGIEIGAPLLCITRIARNQHGEPINYIRALYRPDLYEFEIHLTTDPYGELWTPTGDAGPVLPGDGPDPTAPGRRRKPR